MPEQVHDGCPFCIDNGKLEAIAWLPSWREPLRANAYLVRDTGFPELDVYLIIPFNHVETLTDLPNDWAVSVKALVQQIPGNNGTREIITTTNFGTPERRADGTSVQTIAHLHTKVVLVPKDMSVLGLTSYHALESRVRERFGISLRELVESVLTGEDVLTRRPL